MLLYSIQYPVKAEYPIFLKLYWITGMHSAEF